MRVSKEQARLLGHMGSLGFELRNEANLSILTEDVLKSSDIEGETLAPDQVRSSIARQLGMDIAGLIPADRNVDGVVEMMLDASANYTEALTEERLFAWHRSLFPTGQSGMTKIRVGNWRVDKNGPMQVVSGPIGKEKVHYEALPANRIAEEMSQFMFWFEQPGDMALARSENTEQRFYSMSAQIRRELRTYYNLLERTQKGGLDITQWQNWFLNCLLSAIEGAQKTLSVVLNKSHFWERFAKEPLNKRQIKVLNKMLDGLEGKLTTSKWSKIAKCSQDTAYRDILDLIKREALQKNPAGGRSTSYSLKGSNYLTNS